MFKILLSVTLVAAVLGVPHNGVFPRQRPGAGRIVGGEEARIEDFPYQVSFRYYDEHMCGGSILNKDTILTAAHCTDGLRASKMTIMVGSENVEEGQVYQVDDFFQHPLYKDPSTDYDMSVLKLATPLTFSDKVKPIELQGKNDEVDPGVVATVSGWGALFEDDEETPAILRKVNLNVISDEECKAAYSGSRITPRMLCAKGTNKDSCQGDSGGPLVANNKLIGVVSWGIGCARPRYPGVYAKVSYLRSWIDPLL